MTTIKPREVNAAMLDPTWVPTNNPLAAPAIASPMRSSTWANFLTRDCIVVTHGARRHQVRTFWRRVEDTTDARLPAERRDELAPFNRLFPSSPHRFDDRNPRLHFSNH